MFEYINPGYAGKFKMVKEDLTAMVILEEPFNARS